MKTLAESYLLGFLFWSDLPLGAIPLVMIYHLTGGSWGTASRRIIAAISDTVLAIALLSVPVLFWVREIYPWMEPSVAADPKVSHKHLYLNPASFALRTVIYFVCWVVLNHLLQRDARDPGDRARARLKRISAGGLVLVGFISTFASIDWQMSVEPTWYSTIYGMVYATGQSLTAYAFALMVFGWVCARDRNADRFSSNTLLDLGNILLVLVMLWAYLSFMQYLIVWSGDLPHEVTWYLHRTQGGWQWVALLLFLFQFLAPFVLLLFRRNKSTPARLGWLGAGVFLVRVVDHFWMLMPAFSPGHFTISILTLGVWAVMGACWCAFFLKKLGRDDLQLEGTHA